MVRKGFVLGASFAVLFAGAAVASANDNIVSSVSIPSGQPVPIIADNGSASGTIRLNYTYVGTSFPCGPFAQFTLGLSDQAGGGTAGTYTSELALAQLGSGTPVQMAALPSLLDVSGPGWSANSTVTVSIDCSKLVGSPRDGDTIDGQIGESISVVGSHANPHVNTITSVQVHITLVVPTTCIKLYSFESDQDTGDLVTSVVVNASRGTIRSTNPGQLSVDVLVVNTCQVTETFDALVSLDPMWDTNPHGNPGNATFTYTTAGEFDPATYSLAAFGSGTPQGEKLCLGNVSLPSGFSFLVRVHSAIIGGSVLNLPADGDFDFGGALYSAGSNCAAAYVGAVDPSNPVWSKVTYTVH
jgi:hypothetical protein